MTQKEIKLEINNHVARVLNFLSLEDRPEKADIIFILGSSTLAPVIRAAELYHAGYAPNIAFISIGGRFGGDHVWGIPEYVKYRETLNNLSVPERAIFSTGLSTNTLEEAKQAIPFLREQGIDPTKIILVSRPVHQRRAWATFSKQYPAIKFINCPAQEHIEDIEPDRIVAEIDRLILYGIKGDLLTTEIPVDILDSVEKIRKTNKQYP